MPSPRTTNGSATLNPILNSTRQKTSSLHRRNQKTTWSGKRPWTGCSVATWALERRKLPCAPRSNVCVIPSSAHSWCPNHFSVATLPNRHAPDGGVPGPHRIAFTLPNSQAAGGNHPQAQARRGRYDRRHPPAGQQGRQIQDLGLVIIDEEQRFGVAQKEKLKSLCNNVDVLTLSATPFPVPQYGTVGYPRHERH